MLEKVKEFIKKYFSEIILAIFVILISLLSFALGFITAKFQEKEPLRIELKDIPLLRADSLRKGVGQDAKRFARSERPSGETSGFTVKENSLLLASVRNRGFLKSEPEGQATDSV